MATILNVSIQEQATKKQIFPSLVLHRKPRLLNKFSNSARYVASIRNCKELSSKKQKDLSEDQERKIFRYSAGSPLVIEEEHGYGVVQLTLNRPAALNAFSEDLYFATAAALRRHNVLASTRIIVLTGSGERTFCAGMDIKEVCSQEQAQRTVRAARTFMEAVLDCEKPVVAAVFGAVTGIGVTLLMHCDGVFSTCNATFETPFSAIGIVPEFGSSVTFPLFLGLQLTSDLLMRGIRVGAVELKDVGALRIVDSEDRDFVVEKAVNEALRWSKRNPSSEEWVGVLEAKRLARDRVIKDTREAIDKEMKVIGKHVDDGTASRLMRRRVAELVHRKSKL